MSAEDIRRALRVKRLNTVPGVPGEYAVILADDSTGSFRTNDAAANTESAASPQSFTMQSVCG